MQSFTSCKRYVLPGRSLLITSCKLELKNYRIYSIDRALLNAQEEEEYHILKDYMKYNSDSSTENIADICTRRDTKLADIQINSDWQVGPN